MEAAEELEQRYRGATVDYRGAAWRIESVFVTRNGTGRSSECAASGRPVPVDDHHLVVGAERREYSFDYDHRTGFVVHCPETLDAWVDRDADADDTGPAPSSDAVDRSAGAARN